jgi:ABC-type multidrug transport system permease subunit
MRITTIIKKNFKVLIRSRTSALIVVFGPLLIIILAGLAFNNFSSYIVKVGVYSTNYNELTNSFIGTLEQRDFSITKFETIDLCVDSIKQGDSHACIIFPSDFRLEDDVSNEITFYVDYSKTNLVYMILETVSSTIGMRAEELSLELTTQIIDVLEYTKTTVDQKSETADEMITDATSLQTKLSAMQLTSPNIDSDMFDSIYGSLRFDIRKIQNDSVDIFEQTDLLIDIAEQYTNVDIAEQYTNVTEIKEKIDDLNKSLTGRLRGSFDDLDEFNDTISSFNRSLDTLQKNLGDAQALKTDSENLIKNIKIDLEDIKNSMKTISDKIDALQVMEAGTIVSPITTNIQPIVPEKTYLSYLFPSLVIMLILLVGIMLSSNLVIMEKTSRAYFRNFTTPASDLVFIGANYLTSLIITVLQVSIILAISAFIFKTNLLMGLPLTLLVVFLSISLFSFIGLIIGHFYNSEETSSIASISIASLFLLLSNLILPLESMPETIINIAQYNPFVMASELLKQAILFNATIQSAYTDLIILGIYCVVLFAGLIFVQQISKFRFFKGIKNKREITEESILNPEPKTPLPENKE